MKSPEMCKRMEDGPVGHLLIRSENSYRMGRSLLQWFLLSLLVSAMAAYLAWACSADAASAVRIGIVSSWMAYGLSYVMDSIWKGVAWSCTLIYLFDAAAYAAATGLAFYLFWPELAQ